MFISHSNVYIAAMRSVSWTHLSYLVSTYRQAHSIRIYCPAPISKDDRSHTRALISEIRHSACIAEGHFLLS